jgi:hypothetical protein
MSVIAVGRGWVNSPGHRDPLRLRRVAARLTDGIGNLGDALFSRGRDNMCASAANAVTMARPMLLAAPMTGAVLPWSLVPMVGAPV